MALPDINSTPLNNSNPPTPSPGNPIGWKEDLAQRLKSFWKDLLSYFNVADDLEPQQDVEQSIRSGVDFKGSQLLVLIFAIFIASLGLNTDSIPVVIGAMLISPLMGPIIGMGLGIGIADYALLKRSFKNISMAVLGSLAASAIYFLISPQYEGSSQLLARTSPSIYDVFVALFGGAAGFVSIACRNKGQVMPGVAIATSLMPPLCTAGYGIATWQGHFFWGALYLFFTNMIFILFATWIGVKILKYKGVVYQNNGRNKRVQTFVTVVVFCTVGVSCFLTVQMIRKNIFLAKAQNFVEQQMVFSNTQVLSHKEYIESGKHYIDVTLIGSALPKDSLQLAMMNKLDSVGLGGTILQIKQGFSVNSLSSGTSSPEKNFAEFYSMAQQELLQRQSVIDSLKEVISGNNRFSQQSAEIVPEVKVLFPSVKDMALSQMVVTSVDSVRLDTVSMVFVKANNYLPETERRKLLDFLRLRFDDEKLGLTVNPINFPWPR
ncbi:MAG: TIGR00341 family protein [Muribaculaceae bacterium]|nr:TIGR00341 family protein [Muribaculaceae bacterium]